MVEETAIPAWLTQGQAQARLDGSEWRGSAAITGLSLGCSGETEAEVC